VMISGGATASALGTADDGGFLFRDIGSDKYQALAMTYYLRHLATPPAAEAVLAYQPDEDRHGPAHEVRKDFEAGGGTVTASVAFALELDSAATGSNTSDEIWGQIAAAQPALVVLITYSGDALKLTRKWQDSGLLPGLQWFFTDGLKSKD